MNSEQRVKIVSPFRVSPDINLINNFFTFIHTRCWPRDDVLFMSAKLFGVKRWEVKGRI